MFFQGLRESGGQLEFNMIRAWVEEPIHRLDLATFEQAFQQNVGCEAFCVVQPNHESGRDNMETFQGIQHVPELCR